MADDPGNPVESQEEYPESDEPIDDVYEDQEGDHEGKAVDWVEAASFGQPGEAHIARLKLESEGIDCYLDNENMVHTDWLMTNAVGGVKLKVPAEDLDRARMALQARAPAEIESPKEDHDLSGDHCPRCDSTELSRKKVGLKIFVLLWIGLVLLGWLLAAIQWIVSDRWMFAVLAMLLMALIFTIQGLIRSRKLVCDNCGLEWSPREDARRGFPVITKDQGKDESAE